MFNTFSLPGFQCIDGLLLPEHLQLSVGRNSDSILPELFPTVEQYIPISLLLFLKLDYQSLFIDISLPWSDDNTSVQECRGILAARCASCNCMTYFSCAPLQSCRRLYRLGDLLPADILNAHYDLFFPYKSVLFLTIYIFDWLYYIMERIAEQVFFSIFVQFISHLQRKENSCYVMLKIADLFL